MAAGAGPGAPPVQAGLLAAALVLAAALEVRPSRTGFQAITLPAMHFPAPRPRPPGGTVRPDAPRWAPVRSARWRMAAVLAMLAAAVHPGAGAADAAGAKSATAPTAILPPARSGGDARAGEQLARAGKAPSVAPCIGCHGARGEGVADFPPLAGTGRDYLLAQLDAFAEGGRQNPVMAPIAKALSPADRADAAAYFSGLPNPVKPAAAPLPAADDAGGWLAVRGRWSDGVPACAACHGPAGQGVGAHFPPIAHLSVDYMRTQIQAWKDGTRPPGPLSLMRDVARKLGADDVQAVAAYYARLQGRAAAPAATVATAPGATLPAAATTPAAAATAKVAAAPTGAPSTPEAASSSPGPAAGGAAPPAGASATRVRFTPPGDRKIPANEMGAVIRAGERIFLRTGDNARAFVGNSLNCVNCHLDAGRLAGSAPMWGAYPLYPAYRNKTRHVDTFAERLRGCFMYSMNGKAPPEGGDVLVALEAYAYWMAQGAPIGGKLPGSGYPKVAKPAQPPDFGRGRAVFEARCALCHGADGQGQRAGGAQVFPPLWGAQSFNWGAGMHEIDKAAAFIKANMPLGQGGTLSDQEAWDVATFMNSQPRPQDPRFTGNVAETRRKFHDSEFSMYGQTVNGKVLGAQR